MAVITFNSEPKNNWRIRAFCFQGFLCFFLLLFNCPYVFSGEPYEVRLVKLDKAKLKDTYSGPFKHPYGFTVDEVESLLRSVYFAQSIILWQKPRPLFLLPLAKKMAPKLRLAFRKATPRQAVSFSIHLRNLKVEGETFVNKRGLNWKIASISNRSEALRQTGLWDNNWKLVARKGQRHVPKTDLLGIKSKNIKWIVIPERNFRVFYSLFNKGNSKSGMIGKDLKFDEKKFVARLRKLKAQYKSKAINREKYIEKLNKIIDQSGWNKVSINKQMQVFQIIDRERLLPRKNPLKQ